MKRTQIQPELSQFPEVFRELIADAKVFDSSCSPQAQVYYIEKEGGLYLKSAPSGALEAEAAMTRYFHQKGLATQVLAYEKESRDWLLTRRIPGEDCTHPMYLEDPKRLCETTAALLRGLHEESPEGCPVPDRMTAYLSTARQGYLNGKYDPDLFPDGWGFGSREDAWAAAQAVIPHLRHDTLLHGDYCLPNIMLENWRFTGFLDLDCGGVGDRHIDLFWGAWTLRFNLKTDAYCDRFLDAYGRDRIETELLRGIAALETFA